MKFQVLFWFPLSFHWCPLHILGSNPGSHSAFVVLSPASSGLGQFVSLPWVSMTLMVLRSFSKLFGNFVGFIWCFSYDSTGVTVFEGRWQKWGAVVESRVPTGISVTSHCGRGLGTWLVKGLSCLSTVKLLFTPCMPPYSYCKEVTV